ncbi:4-hydroxy-tetrahydrodipicolinate reductase [Neiella marina]|uniref:4-hydroxy-tetrahydrodipicolinate reductase n=1 Tax=Neiella holothuriorum TaxID=2870530 RepID=A0ABS7EFG6_9GAMM|nr:4-hydroxy-tetrahydrodipicolinate reductase [Neiella holothuriorum]MBW8190995.1 4-hydroxy-tetrahydrodipicolinate reductase [Neiella holothuriorum]
MSNQVRVAIAGCQGRMGKTLLEVGHQKDSVTIGGAFERPESSLIGVDAGELAGLGVINVPVTAGLQGLEDHVDVVIDFTVPEATLVNLAWCREHGKKLVIGTTGFTDAQQADIAEMAKDTAVMMAPNMSVAVNLMFKLLEQASAVMSEHDIEIIEAHHRFKKDAPSGTALKMGQVIADTLGRDLNECAVYGREGITGERDPKTIGFATVRAGDIIGEHTAMFADIGERLEITHKSSSRATYANGAMRAANWLMDKETGLYDMFDVLDLK